MLLNLGKRVTFLETQITHQSHDHGRNNFSLKIKRLRGPLVGDYKNHSPVTGTDGIFLAARVTVDAVPSLGRGIVKAGIRTYD